MNTKAKAFESRRFERLDASCAGQTLGPGQFTLFEADCAALVDTLGEDI